MELQRSHHRMSNIWLVTRKRGPNFSWNEGCSSKLDVTRLKALAKLWRTRVKSIARANARTKIPEWVPPLKTLDTKWSDCSFVTFWHILYRFGLTWLIVTQSNVMHHCVRFNDLMMCFHWATLEQMGSDNFYTGLTLRDSSWHEALWCFAV
jgi:hypothetical protein